MRRPGVRQAGGRVPHLGATYSLRAVGNVRGEAGRCASDSTRRDGWLNYFFLAAGLRRCLVMRNEDPWTVSGHAMLSRDDSEEETRHARLSTDLWLAEMAMLRNWVSSVLMVDTIQRRRAEITPPSRVLAPRRILRLCKKSKTEEDMFVDSITVQG
jgi:hypothetical protein